MTGRVPFGVPPFEVPLVEFGCERVAGAVADAEALVLVGAEVVDPPGVDVLLLVALPLGAPLLTALLLGTALVLSGDVDGASDVLGAAADALVSRASGGDEAPHAASATVAAHTAAAHTPDRITRSR